jgi:hypothetical protein
VPDKKITDLVDGAPLQPTDEFVVARAGDNFKIDGAEVVAAVTKHDVTISGNTAGALAAISSGTWTLAGGNNITLSQAGNAVTISGGAGGAETQTAISGISASDTLYTSGTVRFTGVGGGVTVSSNTGQRVDISVAAQSVQPETQTFIGGISASDTLYTSGSVRFTGSQAVTVRSGTGQLVIIDAPAQTTQTQNMVAVTLSGNTSGAQALISSGTMTLAGGNNITVSQNGNAVTISGPNVGGAQTGISGLANSETTYTSGSVTLSALGAVTIRSTTGQHFQISVNSQSVQPETQTFIAGISASDTLYTSGSVRFTGSQAVTVRSGTGQLVVIDAPAQTTQTQGILSAGVSTGGNTAGNTTVNTGSRLVFAGAGAASLSQATAAGASTISISVPVQTAQTGISGIANSQTTYTSGTVSLSELGAITIRSTTGNQFQFSVNAQSVQPETQTFIGGISASDTLYTSGSVRFTGVGGGVTVSSNTGQRVDISVAAPVAATNLSVGASNIGNTAGDTGVATGSRLVIAGGNNITISQGTAAGATTLTISAPNLGAGAMSAGASNLGNTAGDTGITGTQLVFVGSNNITLSQATDAGGGTLSFIGGGGGGFSAGVSTGGNTLGDTGVTGTRLVFVGDGRVSLSQVTDANGGTISVLAPDPYLSNWPAQGFATTQTTMTSAMFASAATRTTVSMQVWPIGLESPLSVNRALIPVHLTVGSGTTNSNWSWTMGQTFGLYSMNAGTLSLVMSLSNVQRISYASTNNSTNASASWQMSYGSGAALSSSTSLSTANAGNTSIWTSITNIKAFPFAQGDFSISGGQYFGGYAFSSSSAGANLASVTAIGINSQGALFVGEVGKMIGSTFAHSALYGRVTQTLTNTGIQVSFLSADVSTNTNAVTIIRGPFVLSLISQ